MSRARRRQYGTGSVYQRASDRRWMGQFHAGWLPTGGPRVLSVSAACPCPNDCRGPGKCPGEVEAKKRLERRKLAYAEDSGQVAGGHLTVKAWSEQWLAQHRTKARPRYFATDASAVKVWIVPTLGDKRLDALTPALVRRVGDAVKQAGRSSTTAAYAHGVLIRMLDAAAADGHTISRIAREVEAPTKAVNDRDSVPLEHALAMLSAAAKQPDGSRWVAAFLQGMRQGECLGLTWDCVDLELGTLDVSWQLQDLPYAHGCAPAGNAPTCRSTTAGRCPRRVFATPDGFESRQLTGAAHLVRPKTESGWRVIPLVGWMTSALTAWKAVAPASPHDLVWPITASYHSSKVGAPRDPAADRDAWYALQDAAKVRIGAKDPRVHRKIAKGQPVPRYMLHEARHTTATLLQEANVPDHVITAIMGHASILSTRPYFSPAKRAALLEALQSVATTLQLSA